jgi:RecA-family ATPase
MPDGSAGLQGSVLVLSAEDGLADTIRPRLDAAGADPARVITITEIACATDRGQQSRPVSIPGDLPVIEHVIAEHAVCLVIVDVLVAYLSADVNAHRDQDVRRALHVLSGMAERNRCCVLVLRHLNKSSGGNALYRGGGSIGIIGAARPASCAAATPTTRAGCSACSPASR